MSNKKSSELTQLIKQLPDLTPVIIWLENGCSSREAALELRLYQEKIQRLQLNLIKGTNNAKISDD
jgi:hypothetical protein